MFQRPPDSIDDAGKHEASPEEPETSPDRQPDELFDASDLEESITDNLEAGLTTLKQRALDRLAEVLARFKTTKSGRVSKRPDKSSNLDAKNVTSVVMIEESDDQRVTFLCSKNEGLAKEDEVFLEKLGKLLSSAPKSSDDGKRLPRVDYYYAALRDAYRQAASVQMPPTLTEDTMKLVSSHRVGVKEWQGIVIDIDQRPTLSWEVADCLSNKERDEAVADMCDSIQTLFMADKAPYHEIRDFIGGFYAAIQNPRERAGLKNLLRQSLHGCERLFSKAWSALLFLARPFDAALVLVELSSTLQPFHSFRFIAIPARKFRTAKYLGMRTSPPLETLIALQCQPQNKEWVEFLRSRKAARVYSNKLGISRSIHAEVQLIGWLESRGFKTDICEDDAADGTQDATSSPLSKPTPAVIGSIIHGTGQTKGGANLLRATISSDVSYGLYREE
ncbi:hypothetical protein ATERTT37_004714 [Aspergillus terreus]